MPIKYDPFVGLGFNEPRMTPSSLLGPGFRMVPDEMSDDEEQQIKALLASKALGGLQTVGAILDTPGGVVRNLLGGGNVMGTLAPSQADQRVSGRDLLEQMGILGPNQEGLDLGDVAGFAAEIATDPLTYLTFGGSALGKAGKLLKSAGVYEDVIDASVRSGGALGPRTARIQTTLKQAMDLLPDAQKKQVMDTALAKGVNTGKLMEQKLGGLLGVGFPLAGAPGMLTPTFGSVGDAVAGGMDKIGGGMRYSAPGRLLASTFNADLKQATSKEGQQIAKALSREQERIAVRVRRAAIEDLGRLERAGVTTAGERAQLRRYLEGVDDTDNHVVQEWLDQNRKQLDDLLERSRVAGVNVGGLRDAANVLYAPRSMPWRRGPLAASGGAFGYVDEAAISRKDYLKGVEGGTEKMREIISDMDIENAADHKVAAHIIKQKYGDLFVGPSKKSKMRQKELKQLSEEAKKAGRHLEPEEIAELEQLRLINSSGSIDKRIKDLAKMIKNEMTFEQRRAGGFSEDVLIDLERRMKSGEQTIAAANTITGAVAKFAAKAAEATDEIVSGAPPAGLTVQQLFGKMKGMHNQRALKAAAKQAGVKPSEFASYVVKTELAEDMSRMWKGFTAPDAVSKMGQFLDDATNYFKVGVLNWPARYVRDFISGQFHNIVTGNYGVGTARDALRIVKGQFGDIDATKYPFVKTRLDELGLAHSQENAVRVLRNELYAQQFLGSPQILERSAGRQAASRLLDAETGDFTPFQQMQHAWKNPRKSLNPLSPKIQGIALGNQGVPREATDNLAVNLGEIAGTTTDNLNRLVPFLENLKRGADPEEASRIANALQIDYRPQAYSETEKKLLKRAFPFYSFSSRMMPQVIKELAEEPGGRLAQFIKASAQASQDDDLLPPHVTQGLSVPVHKLPAAIQALVGSDDPENKRYLTGLGLMHEDPLGFAGGAKDAGMEVLSRLNPLVKGPLELITGQSFFQRGIDGKGRPLSEMDPPLGRLLSNVRQLATGEEGATEPVRLGGLIEAVSANSPLSRLVSTAKTLTDPRKKIYSNGKIDVSALVNAASGLKFSDITPYQQDRVLQEAINARLEELGGKAIGRVAVPEYLRAALPPEQQDELDELKALMAMLQKKKDARAKAAEESR